MATMKRRVIYASDDDWATLLAESAARKQSVSSLIRDWLRDLWTVPAPKGRGPLGPVAAIHTESLFAASDALNRRARAERPFRRPPFTPAPKKGK